MKVRARSNRICLLESRGFVSCDRTEGGKRFQADMEILFESFPPHSFKSLRRVPQFIAGYRKEFAAALTVVFDPLTGNIWFKPEMLDLSSVPFCFRDMTPLARTYERLAIAGR